MLTAEPVVGQRRDRAWVRVSHGLYKPRQKLDGLVQDLAAWRLVLPPTACFTHLTAAQVYGWWLPPLPVGLPVFASVRHADHRVRRSGLRTLRHSTTIDQQVVEDLPMATPAESRVACASHLGVLDVTVLLDAALHLEHCTRDDVGQVIRGRRRGSPTLRRALTWADGRSESAWETLLRVLHEVCGVPVEPQLVLLDEQGGFVARGDLHLMGTHVLHEYDGAEHRQKARHRRDLARERRIGNVVWTRRGYTDAEVLHQAVAILRDADQSIGRAHRPERVRAWHRLLADSLFTPSGTARFLDRVGLAAAEGTPRDMGHERHRSGSETCSS